LFPGVISLLSVSSRVPGRFLPENKKGGFRHALCAADKFNLLINMDQTRFTALHAGTR
jgi:hypothetical protein